MSKHKSNNRRGKKGGGQPKGRAGNRGGKFRTPSSDPQNENRSGGGGTGGGRRSRGGRGPSQNKSGEKKFRSRSEKAQQRRGRGTGKVLQGRVDKNASGFAFLIPTEEGFEDVYVNRREASQLMSGDVVEFSVEHDGERSQARIHKVLQRSQNKLVGRLQQQGKRWSIATADGQHLEVDPAGGERAGDWVVADIEKYPDDRRAGTVQITKKLGQSLGPSHDMELAIARYNLAEHFSPSALDEAESQHSRAEREAANVVPFADRGKGTFFGKRVDLQPLPLVTIDGEDAKDFDDAVLVQKNPKGYTLFVAIADVSFFVLKGSALDYDARMRGTSTYFPGTCLPMLPETLSNDLCSLRPQQPRLALTAEMEFDHDGQEIGSKFYPALIKTAQRLTYTQVQEFIDGKEDAVSEIVRQPMREAYELYQKLDKQRALRGVMDFDLPECKLLLDETGFPLRVFKAERVAAHKLIEEFMIAANREVAKALREQNVPALYRVHESPDPESLEELNALLVTLGIPKRVEKLSPKAFAHVLEGTAELKIAGTLHQSILRLQKQAKYIPEPKGHFGLALADYTHFTSPIRRYPDLVVHRALKGLCMGNSASEKKAGAGTPEEMSATGMQNSESERRSMEAERFVLKRKQCWYMQGKLGEEFEGIISGVTTSGLFVGIPWMAIEGFVPIEFLHGHYEIDKEHMCARQRPGSNVLYMGDGMRIKVAKVSLDENRITFAEA